MANKRKSLASWKKSEKRYLRDSNDPQVKQLIDAASDGEFLEISYDGGSRPGSIRKILPKDVFYVPDFGNYVSAYDYLRHEDRTFRLSRIRVLDEIKDSPKPNNQQPLSEPKLVVPVASSRVRSTPIERKKRSTSVWYLIVGITLLTVIITQQ
jgi:predicted DNA-binding transcriptional regulator YafY